MTFAWLSTANVHYRLFGQFQEKLPPALQIMTKSVIAIYYSKYGKLFEDLEDQLMLDNDKIVGNTRTTENVGDGGDTRDVGKVRNFEDTGNKEASRGNKGGEHKDVEVGNDEKGHSGDQEASKVGYDGVDDRVNVGDVLEDIELGNNGVSDSTRNQDNQCARAEDVDDSDDVVVDPTH